MVKSYNKIKNDEQVIREDTDNESSNKNTFLFVLNFIKDKWHLLFLAILLIFFTIHTAFFISRDRSPIVSDSHTHLRFARDSYNTLGNVDKFGKLGYFNTHYPPLVYVVTGFFYRVFGLSLTTARWSIYPFSIIFIIALFFTGFHFGGKSGAVAACLIGTSNIYFINYSHLYMLDIPHSAITCLAMFFLFKSELFKKPVFSYLFGLTFGLALLCRFSTVYFIAGPLIVLFLYFALHSLRLFVLVIPFALGINGMLLYFLKFAYKNKQNLDMIKSRFGFNLIILLTVSAFLIFLTIIVKRKLMGFFRQRNLDVVNQILTGTRSVLLSLIIAMPVYLYIMPMLMFRLTDHIFNLRVTQNLVINYNSLNNFFPMIFILTGIGIIFILIRRKQVLDFVVLISLAISGFIFTTYSAAPFGRYLIVTALAFSVLGGYWIEYIGKLKFIALAFIFSYSALSLSFLFFSPAVPEKLYEINYYEERKLFYMEPVYPTNPDPDMTKMFAMVDDIEREFNHSFRGKYKNVSMYYQFSGKFLEVMPREVQLMKELFRDTYGMNLFLLLQYKNIPLVQEPVNIEIIEYMNRDPSIPLFLLIGYVDGDYPVEILKEIETETGRKSRRISGYGVMGKKKVNIYVVTGGEK